MDFPSQSLLILLKFAKGDLTLNAEVVDAGLEVLKYAWGLITKGGSIPYTSAPEDVVDCIEQALNENTELKGFTPSVWITIGLWVLEKVLTRLSK